MTLGTILIRADASPKIGTGHVMRSLALAQAWQGAGGTAVFAMADSTPSISARLAAEGFPVCPMQAKAGTKEDAVATSKLASARAAAWIAVDGYNFGSDYQNLIKSCGHRFLCIDDIGGSESYSADLVLNQNLNPNPNEEWYRHRHASTRLLLGTRYALLRREFSPWREWKRDVTAVASNVLITMGGSDPDNVTLSVIQALRAAGVMNLEAAVVMGGSNPHFESVANAVKDLPGKIRIEKDAANMPEPMAWADIAVSAAGSTCWEMCMLGLPAIVLDVAPNQSQLARELAKAGCAIHIPIALATVEEIRQKIEFLIHSHQLRAEMSRRSAQLVDGKGAARVVGAMRAQAFTMRRVESIGSVKSVQSKDCQILWEWANHPSVRQASFNSSPISWEEHCRWFAQQMNADRSIFLIFEDDQSIPVATARFRATTSADAEISVTIAPEFRGQGLAPHLLDRAADFAFQENSIERIHAFIKTANRTSAKSFENAGFFLVGATQIQENEALHYVRERSAIAPTTSEVREQAPEKALEIARCR